jgi:hypothetical protein
MLISRMLSATMVAGAPEPRGSEPAATPSRPSRVRPLRTRTRPGSGAGAFVGAHKPQDRPLGRAEAPKAHLHS